MTFKKWIPCSMVALAGLLASTPAYALSCDEILNMVKVNVPSSIVVQTMENSGTRFTADDLRCLVNGGAPEDVIDVARNLVDSSTPTPSAPRPSAPAEDEPQGFDSASMLAGDINEIAEDSGDSSPAKLDAIIAAYKSKKYLTASKGLSDLLEDDTYPGQTSKIQYYLAKSLYDLGMYHGAQHYFMEVVRRGPRNPYFKYALPRLVGIAKHTGNDYELLRIVHKIPPESFPRQAKNHLYYLMGRKLYEKGELSAAAKYFQQISSKSDLYLRAKYFEGIIHNDREKLRSAVRSFRDVYQAEVTLADSRSAADLEDLKDLALINIARIYFSLQRYENSDKYYALVNRNSTYWPQSLFERSWTNFYTNNINHSLGLMLTVNSPYYSENEYIPEITIVKSLAYFNFCEYDEVDRLLREFEADTAPMLEELNAFLEKYKSEEGRKLADQALDTYFRDDHADSTLHRAMFARVLRNRDLASLMRHLDMMDAEIKLVNQQKAVWRDSAGDQIKKIVEGDRSRYRRRAGQVLLQELLGQYRILKDLTTQSEIIRFEVVDAQRMDYEYKMTTADVSSMENKKIDFAVSRDIIYWPFNGEFWQDELGYYRYTENGSCR
jgi:TolA-binding protein